MDTTGLRGTNLDLGFKTGSCLFWNLKTSDTKNIYCKFLIGIRHLISGPPLKLGRTIENHGSSEPQEERGDDGETNSKSGADGGAGGD